MLTMLLLVHVKLHNVERDNIIKQIDLGKEKSNTLKKCIMSHIIVFINILIDCKYSPQTLQETMMSNAFICILLCNLYYRFYSIHVH